MTAYSDHVDGDCDPYTCPVCANTCDACFHTHTQCVCPTLPIDTGGTE